MWDKSFSVVLAALVVTGCAAHTVTSGRVVVRDDRAAEGACSAGDEYATFRWHVGLRRGVPRDSGRFRV